MEVPSINNRTIEVSKYQISKYQSVVVSKSGDFTCIKVWKYRLYQTMEVSLLSKSQSLKVSKYLVSKYRGIEVSKYQSLMNFFSRMKISLVQISLVQ